ncbi:2-dehydro-3-deoxygalactonokinase [Petroclostridium xylanilyticum]|uniref:2-dehydro-3-deoxygalactonokinase n=1 Tax=Petroclostridium xylanilyticum TaxID=1792311 RepID=UPI0012FF87BE|nr:2-dehydro-3-deoxygalactonokinase [Petroclostridium xylanilyticum]
MKDKKIVYYDSGTSNTRIYLLNEDFEVLFTEKKNVGSKDSAIAGSNNVLIDGMKELYDVLLQENELSDEDISEIYASGMVTSPYGLIEVPHLIIPITIKNFAESIYCHYEGKRFKRNIYLVPGIKTTGDDISFINNMRGEEIEIIGTLDELIKKCPDEKVAVIMPGSHTHIACIENDEIKDIISNFTGELFYALKTATILSPVLSVEAKEFNKEMILKGCENLRRFGINRAIYICHAMRLFNNGDEISRLSYIEGVITGAVGNVLDYYCEYFWTGCETAAIVANEKMYEIYSTILSQSKFIKNIIWMPISNKKSYAIDGLRKIINSKI